MPILNFASIDAQCFQKPNPSGVMTILVATHRSIVGSWPNLKFDANGNPDYTNSTINASNTITAIPTLITGAKWAMYEFPINTASIDCERGNDPSYQSYKHSIEYAMAGFSPALKAEVRKSLNAGSVIIARMKDGQWCVLGSSDNPIFVTANFTSGKGGNDKRGYTIKGEVDGMMWDLALIPDSLVQTLSIDPIVAA